MARRFISLSVLNHKQSVQAGVTPCFPRPHDMLGQSCLKILMAATTRVRLRSQLLALCWTSYTILYNSSSL
jgi:hypothetical protein